MILRRMRMIMKMMMVVVEVMILKELLSYQRAPLLASREVHNRNTSITISMLYSFISVGH